jgi:phosphoglycolate phosphatase
MTMAAIALVSFDLDGTLVDTAGEIAEAANRTLAAFGVAARDPAEITGLVGHGAAALLRGLCERVRRDDPAAHGRLPPEPVLLQAFQAHYLDTTGTSGAPYPGALDALPRLRNHGLKVACVTNKPLRHTEQLLRVHAMAPLFDLVLGGDSLPQRKPDPAVLAHVGRVLGVPAAATVHVGDSATDVLAARGAGVRAWAVPWGYNGGRPIAESAPDAIFDSLAAVAAAALVTPPWRPG